MIAFANKSITYLRSNHFRKIYYHLNKGKEKKTTPRQKSIVITVILNVEIKTSLHLELICLISTVSQKKLIRKDHLKTFSLLKACHTQTSHWHFSPVFISTFST